MQYIKAKRKYFKKIAHESHIKNTNIFIKITTARNCFKMVFKIFAPNG